MCGIVGWISFDRDLTTENTTLRTMTETMSCRGPDAEGVWLERHAAIGHRRLSVIDLEGGTQPMVVETAEGPVVLTYSGETYNYTELRDDLRRRGHRFRTVSDTEVVLRGYLEWGPGVAERLNGMYAFAVWDSRSQRLVMVRDRMGIKPFYYYLTSDGVLFGSEPKAILANPLAEGVIDQNGLRELYEMISFAKTPGNAIWAGMREVRPGTVVTVDRDGLRSHTYWRLRSTPHTDDLETTVAHVRELLDDTVRRQLVADVPRCVLLSGGLDSSVLTGLAGQQLAMQGEQVRSFAVDFTGHAENFVPDELRDTADSPFVLAVREHVGTLHEDIVLDPGAMADPEVRRAVVTARDMPVGLGDVDFSLYLLFKAIREHSTVALSGESADEVFGGYKWFHDTSFHQAGNYPWTAVVRAVRGDLNDMLNPELVSTLDIHDHVRDSYAAAIAEVEGLDGETDDEFRMRQTCYLHLTRFMRVLLDRKDRMSMAVGLEVRVPFCDHRLVEYAYNTPWSMKTFDGREKSLLRGATADVVPRSVAERIKTPYPSTQDTNYVSALQQQARQLLAERDNEVFTLVNRDWLTKVADLDPQHVATGERSGLEQTLDYGVWLEECRPELRLS